MMLIDGNANRARLQRGTFISPLHSVLFTPVI